MAIVITKRVLSGSVHGAPISITATRGAVPTPVHLLSTSATTTVDEVYIYAHNDFSATIDLVLEWGISTTALQMTTPIPGRDGVTLVIPGLILTGSACSINALVNFNATSSFAASNNLITVTGFVNKLVQT